MIDYPPPPPPQRVPAPRRRRVEVVIGATLLVGSATAFAAMVFAVLAESTLAGPPERLWAASPWVQRYEGLSMNLLLFDMAIGGGMLLHRRSRPHRSARAVSMLCAGAGFAVVATAWALAVFYGRAQEFGFFGPGSVG